MKIYELNRSIGTSESYSPLDSTIISPPKLQAGQDRPSKSTVQEALDANKRLQLILAERAEELEAELKEADRLIQAASTDEGDEDPEAEVLIPGSKKAAGLLTSSEFLNASFPFHNEAKKRSTYLANTTPHPMKPKDLEVLADGVRQENQRLQAYARLKPGSNVDIDLENNIEGLDWTRISEKVSDASSVKRTPTECRVAWIGDRHPRINHAEWSNPEIKNLEAIVSDYMKTKQTIDWVWVAERLATNRTPIDCMRHGLPPPRHTWSPEYDKKLTKAVGTFGVDNWQLVAKNVSECVTASQCQTRWQKSLDPSIKRGAWTEEEDEILRKAVVGYGKLWVQVSTAVPGRTNDQCRERWTEHINSSSSKATWSDEEDEHLLELVEDLGKQWRIIAIKLGGNKTGQSCRFRYDKLKRASDKSKNTPQPQVTPPLSIIGSPVVPNVAGPNHLVSTQTTSTIFTFAPNLGQNSFAPPSIPASKELPIVNYYPPSLQCLDANHNASEVDSSDMPLSVTTEQILDFSLQSGIAQDPPTVPQASNPKVAETPQTANGTVPTAKSRPKPRLKLLTPTSPTTYAPSETIDRPDISMDSPLTDISSTPLGSDGMKTAGPTKGRKRKADSAVPEQNQGPKKKARQTKPAMSTAIDKPAEIASKDLDDSSSNLPAARTEIGQTSVGPNSNDAPVTENPQPHLRRGRSRKILSEPDARPLPQISEPLISVTPSNPPSKRPRGRPRKVQKSS